MEVNISLVLIYLKKLAKIWKSWRGYANYCCTFPVLFGILEPKMHDVIDAWAKAGEGDKWWGRSACRKG